MTKSTSNKPPYLSSRWRGPGQPRLLLVDDDDVMRRSSQRFLSRAGFEVVAVASAADALEVIDDGGRIDAAVIDLEMPEMDGIELMRVLQARRHGLPVGLWSASQRLEHLTAEELALAWFVKPKMHPIGELVQAVCQAVYGARTPYEANGGEPSTAGNGHDGNGQGGNGSYEARPARPTTSFPTAAAAAL